MMVLSFTTIYAKSKVMDFLKKNGPITWRDIIGIVPEIIEEEKKRNPKIVIPDATIQISHRLTRINLRVNRRLMDLKRRGKIGKRMVKFSKGCFNILMNGNWKTLSNLKELGVFFPPDKDTDDPDSEVIPQLMEEEPYETSQ